MKKGGDVIRVSGRLEKTREGSGYALFARHEGFIPPGQYRMVSAGVEISDMPPGLIGYVCNTRMMAAQGLVCAPLVVDGTLKGEIMLTLFNAGSGYCRIAVGECIGRLFFSLALSPQIQREMR
ncbi:hypothetical protein NB640_10960 [Oxalobacter vibrioformis]|uniref:dUTPase-like domain-containing protein n=1 Tax=Oxalobacter vibrioformis TaxID=933080 RepID=A0A9E9P2C3_9BURK|nr:hypothetical protein [Oxalobacter vibrioformis]WAW09734.1 hypothetical protein NB640_10960 [Oxalobacter vibrioformis]